MAFTLSSLLHPLINLTPILLSTLLVLYLALCQTLRFRRARNITSANDGRINLLRGRKYPWYIRPTFKKRWGPLALLTRLRGGVLPGDDAAFMPEGFLSRELGPMGLKGKGQEEVEEEVRRLGREGGGGCPFVTL